MVKIEELLEEYKAAARSLRARRDRLRAEYNAQGGQSRCDMQKRLRHVGEMYEDVVCTIREIEYYIGI